MLILELQNDNYTGIYDGKMANCCQKVRGDRTNQRPKQQQKQKQAKQKKTNPKQQTTTTTKREEGPGCGGGGWGVKKQITNRMV